MRLVDDLVEPFRPFVDYEVCQMIKKKHSAVVTADVKKVLVSMLEIPVRNTGGKIPLRTAIQNTAISLSLVFAEKRNELDLPIFD